MDGSQRHFMSKFYNWLFFTTSNKIIWPKIFLIFMHGYKSAILAAGLVFERFQTSMILNPFGVAIQAVVDVIIYFELLFKLFSTYCDLKNPWLYVATSYTKYKTFYNYFRNHHWEYFPSNLSLQKILNRIKLGEKCFQ